MRCNWVVPADSLCDLKVLKLGMDRLHIRGAVLGVLRYIYILHSLSYKVDKPASVHAQLSE